MKRVESQPGPSVKQSGIKHERIEQYTVQGVTDMLFDSRKRVNIVQKRTAKHIKYRLNYTGSHSEHESKYWNSVRWPDETKLELYGHMYLRYACRKMNEADKPKIPPLQLSTLVGTFCYGDVLLLVDQEN